MAVWRLSCDLSAVLVSDFNLSYYSFEASGFDENCPKNFVLGEFEFNSSLREPIYRFTNTTLIDNASISSEVMYKFHY